MNFNNFNCMLIVGSTCVVSIALVGCDDDDSPGENAGADCEVPADCYPGVDPEDLSGDVECMDRVPGGYCTHLCETDEDCCAAPDECDTGLNQVCAPFESMAGMRCFLSCESDDVGDEDDNEYCRRLAHPDFGCRSTGGGSDNRKVCLP